MSVSTKNVFKIVLWMGIMVITILHTFIMAEAYDEGNAGDAVIVGRIYFRGTPPPSKIFPLNKYPSEKFCSQIDHDGKGNRILQEVTVQNSRLQDVVVSIKDITRGKPFPFKGTDVKIERCQFLVQGGPSAFVGVVVDGAEIRVLNEDLDVSDPKKPLSILHNPHGLEYHGVINFNLVSPKPLLYKGQLKAKVQFKEENSVMSLYCQQHLYERAWFYPVKNPYYAIVGSDGTYVIDQSSSRQVSAGGLASNFRDSAERD
jgi:hypothetical protein